MTFKWKIKITLANVTGWDQNCQVQTRITPTMICPVDRTWYFLSHNINTHHRFLILSLPPSPIIMIIVHPSSGLSFYVDGSLKLMWVETDGWKKAGPSHWDYCASRNSSPWLKPQLKSGGGVSNKKNITDYFVQWFLCWKAYCNVDISHCSGWSQSWCIKLYRPSVWKLRLNLNSVSV